MLAGVLTELRTQPGLTSRSLDRWEARYSPTLHVLDEDKPEYEVLMAIFSGHVRDEFVDFTTLSEV